MLRNELTELLQIDNPILQAPMAGGITTPSLVSAVSNHGGLGSIGAGYLSPSQLRDQIKEVRKMTPSFFGVNLFVPTNFTVSESEIAKANNLLQPIRDTLHIKQQGRELDDSEKMLEIYREQLQIVIEEKVPVCSFTFGIPAKEIIEELKQHKIMLIGTATTVREAIEVEKGGMDIVVVQGSEAGGHRGSFLDTSQESLIGLMSLIPQVVAHVTIPVVAAGGIMDGRGLMASLCLGAKGVQMGTAFLTCVESGAHHVHKEAILHASEERTVVTRAFSGKWARGLENKFTLEMKEHELSFPDFPVQNKLTQEIRKTSSVQNNKDYMSLWSGQSPTLAKNQTVECLMKELTADVVKIKHSFFN